MPTTDEPPAFRNLEEGRPSDRSQNDIILLTDVTLLT